MTVPALIFGSGYSLGDRAYDSVPSASTTDNSIVGFFPENLPGTASQFVIDSQFKRDIWTRVVDVSGVVLSVGSEYQSPETEDAVKPAICALNENTFISIYSLYAGSLRGYAVVGNQSGSVISWGNTSNFSDGHAVEHCKIQRIDDSRAIIAYHDIEYAGSGVVVVATANGDDITYGTPVVFRGLPVDSVVIDRFSDDRVLIGYQTPSRDFVECVVASVSGTTITVGTKFDITSTDEAEPSTPTDIAVIPRFRDDLEDTKAIVVYQNKDVGFGTAGASRILTIDGLTISSVESSVLFCSLNCSHLSVEAFTAQVIGSNNSYILVGFRDYSTDRNCCLGTLDGKNLSWESPIQYNGADGGEGADFRRLDQSRIVAVYNESLGQGSAAIIQLSGVGPSGSIGSGNLFLQRYDAIKGIAAGDQWSTADNPTLFIHGYDSTLGSGNMFVHGYDSIFSSGNLFIYGHESVTASGDLYTLGYESISGSCDLVAGGLDNLFTSGDLYIDGYEEIAASSDIYIHGLDVISTSGDLFVDGYAEIIASGNLFIAGLTPATIFSISGDLFTEGYDDLQASGDLFVDGHEYLTTSGDLYTLGHGTVSGSCDLVIVGLDNLFTSGDLYIDSHGTSVASRNLFVEGFMDTSGIPAPPLFIEGHESIFGSGNLFIDGHKFVTTSGDLYTLGCEAVSDSCDLVVGGLDNLSTFGDLFVYGYEEIAASGDIYLYGLDAISTSCDLLIGGYAEITASGNLFIVGISDTSGALSPSLFIHGCDNISSSGNLFTHGHLDQIASGDMFVYGLDALQTSGDLFVNGAEVLQTSGNLFIAGLTTTTAFSTSGDLFTEGYDDLQASGDLFVEGRETTVVSGDLFIQGNATIPTSGDLYVGGYGTVVASGNLYIFGAANGNNGSCPLFMSGHIGLQDLDASCPLFINGMEPKPALACPILDPTAAIQIKATLITTYQDLIDDVIDQLGKDVLFEFDPVLTSCPNCEFDTIRKRSTGVYKLGGPRPFARGRKCPYCKGRGLLETPVTKEIRCLTQWNPVDAENFGIAVTQDKDIVRLKTYLTNADDIMRANTAIVNYDIVDRMKRRVRLFQGPMPVGLREDRYCISFWELI